MWILSRMAYKGGCLAGIGLLVITLGGCAVAPRPVEGMSRAQAAIEEAEQSGAREYAPLELRFAREKFAAAKDAVREEDYRPAAWLAEEAIVNAQLAEAKAESAKARETAAMVRESVETLRRELIRKEGE